MVGNKIDRYDIRAVNSNEAKEFSQFNGIAALEASAKTNANVDGVFQMLAKNLINKAKGVGPTIETSSNGNLEVKTVGSNEKETGVCCGWF